MALTSGTRLGPYEIESLLGAGGMGEVYRAVDTNLGRPVAVKLLLDAVAQDTERIARFEREAKTLALLNHPNIAAIYGLERGAGKTALVMELVDGPTLDEHIAGKPLPLEDALTIARQIADALEAAHEQSIIHRDLKPANVKVRPDGTVKVLDFGLAKAMELSPSAPGASLSPTITSPAMTQAGVILGSAAYMSPEQARGRNADKRADIWAFGCVLFEMLTGKRVFDGDEVTDTLAFVITREPDWSLLPPSTPDSIRKLLKRALEKDRKNRLADIADARFEIKEAQTQSVNITNLGSSGTSAASSTVSSPARSRSIRILPWALAAVLAARLGWTMVRLAPWRASSPRDAVRMQANLGVDGSLATDLGTSIALSRDGKTLAFVATPKGGHSFVYTRRLDQLSASPLAGTEDARSPFFSPDGQWIAFFASGKLKKISVLGGAAVPLADAPGSRGGAWTDDGRIVFLPVAGGNAGFMQVSAGGGKAEPFIAIDQGASQRWPQILSGGKVIVYTTNSPSRGQNVVARLLPDGQGKVIQENAGYGRYLSSGHLIYVQGSTLFAAPFDLSRLVVTGQPVPIVEDVDNNALNNGAQFTVSESGVLAYLPGRLKSANTSPISWLDPSGKTTPLRATAFEWSSPRFSPDGTRLAVDMLDGNNATVAVVDWTRDNLTRLTIDRASNATPVWTPDGKRIVYRSIRDNVYNLFWQRANGTGTVQRLTVSKNGQAPGSWHKDGRLFAFEEYADAATLRASGGPVATSKIMILPLSGDEASGWKPGTPYLFETPPGNATLPSFSPDGKWLAYTLFAGPTTEVYVSPFPGPGNPRVVSVGGGTNAVWSQVRSELLYSTSQVSGPDQRIMVVPYRVEGDAFMPDTPRQWTTGHFMPRINRSWDLHPDGNRIAVAPVPESPAQADDQLVFVFNFFDELRRLVPTTPR
jgi:serine/threonine-protein kinase